MLHVYNANCPYTCCSAFEKPISSSSIVFSWPLLLWKTWLSFSMLTCLARCPSNLIRCRTRFSICRGHTHSQSGKSCLAGWAYLGLGTFHLVFCPAMGLGMAGQPHEAPEEVRLRAQNSQTVGGRREIPASMRRPPSWSVQTRSTYDERVRG